MKGSDPSAYGVRPLHAGGSESGRLADRHDGIPRLGQQHVSDAFNLVLQFPALLFVAIALRLDPLPFFACSNLQNTGQRFAMFQGRLLLRQAGLALR